jgi:hypothetical protein
MFKLYYDQNRNKSYYPTVVVTTADFRRVVRYFNKEVLLKINRQNYIQQNNNFTYTLLYKHTNVLFKFKMDILSHIYIYIKSFMKRYKITASVYQIKRCT